MLMIKDLNVSRELDDKAMSAIRGGYAANQTYAPQDYSSYGSDYSSYQPTSHEPTSYGPTSYEPASGYQPSGHSDPYTGCNYSAPRTYW